MGGIAATDTGPATGGTLEGSCTPAFEPVRELVQRNLDSGAEVGVSLCVMSGEEVVVDLWGGVADAESGRAWVRDTVVNTYSLTKTMTSLAALVLVDRGLLDPDAPVAHYWPEFAAAGKDRVLVRHVLGHTSGLSGWDERVSIEDLYDTRACADLLARQAPWWSPGASSGYHAMSFGTLVGELVQRVTGASLGRFFDAELAGPLGADYWIGAPEALLAQPDRIATMVPPRRPGSTTRRCPRTSCCCAHSPIRRSVPR